jgi:hypothetical protein
MTAANLAWLLADGGSRVVALDWTFVAPPLAPGLAEYFHPFWPDSDPRMEFGIIDALWDFVLDQLRSASDTVADTRPTLFDHAIPLRWTFPSRGTLDLVNVGLPSSRRIRTNVFPFEVFFSELGGQLFVDRVRQLIQHRYDYAVVDAPPLPEDFGGICTCGLADIVVLCFTLSSTESIASARLLTEMQTLRYRLSADRDLRIVPVAMKSDLAEYELYVEAWTRAKSAFAPLAREVDVGLKLEVPHIPFYQYQQSLGAFLDRPETGIRRAYERIFTALTGNVAPDVAALAQPDKDAFAAKYATAPDTRGWLLRHYDLRELREAMRQRASIREYH